MNKKYFIIFILTLLLAPCYYVQAETTDLSARLKGTILLQVESHGEAWYVNPENEERYYLGRPADAFNIMRELGLGISNKDFDSFDLTAPARLAGKILLRVEQNGEAYYVYPKTLKMYYLGRPLDAFNIMRELGLGITNENLAEINIKDGYGIPAAAPVAEENIGVDPSASSGQAEEVATSTEENIETTSTTTNEAEIETATSTEYIAQYFPLEELRGGVAVERKEYFTNGVDVDWGVGGPEGLGKIDRFSVRFIGTENFDEGQYKFTAVFNDAIKVYLDGGLIMQSWKENNVDRTLNATKDLTAGEHEIRIDYYEYHAEARVKLSWEKIE
ncbi:MAG: PA14 domain-containing protein [bacterium]